MSTILTVNDSPPARGASARVLRQAGFEVWEATTGGQALELVRRGPDLVVLDTKLPDMSGLEVGRRIKDDPATASIPVLHVTDTYGGRQEQAAALEGGADGYLTHPLEPIVLVATIRALLRGREAERRARRGTTWWQTTFDAIGDGVMLLSREARILRVNKAMAELLGRTPEELFGQSGIPALPGMTEPPEGWPVHQALREAQRASIEVELRERWFEVVSDPVLDDSGQVSAVVRTVKDISQRKEAEKRMAELLAREQAARLEAEQVNRLKDEFLATLSHELRTPLNAIVGWAHVLRAGNLDEDTTARAIETIARNANVQAQLISDILDVSRIVAGKLRLELRPLDLTVVIQEALETVRPAAEAKGIRLEPRLEPSTGPIAGDPNRLQQVVWNLLSNAIRFTPREGRVQVRLEAVGLSAVVTVEDSGPGIAPDFLPHVFERFRQADGSSTRRHGGLGLGLAIVRHLVELHGGTVEAENRTGAPGAIFRVTLPRRGVSAEAGPPGPERPSLVAEDPAWLDTAPSLAGTSVLVVDDEADARSLIEYVLERCGARVRSAASASEALRVLEEWRPDVLLADVEMPQEDGYSLIARVRALPAAGGGSTPAAALTGYAGAQDRMKALQAGFQLHVAKPVQPAELADVVATLKSMTVPRA
ncbi:MAG: hybrid sensor histidine kinase/response regulator [Acidobacteria bacterium]|nr:MAG: hybrid sensor histidine kinase/response regulator [Acidobacteriota bacterium]PYQ25598.1 MAG: hybrid sensor histidine kinase/response regulator [Acidobacteriota bacterium]